MYCCVTAWCGNVNCWKWLRWFVLRLISGSVVAILTYRRSNRSDHLISWKGWGWAKSLKFLVNIFVPMSLRNVAFDIRLICHIWNSTYLCLHARYLSWHATYLCQQCAIAFVFTWAWCNLFISTSCKIIMLTCWHNIYIFGSFSVNTKLSSRPFMDCNIHWGVSIKPEFWTL